MQILHRSKCTRTRERRLSLSICLFLSQLRFGPSSKQRKAKKTTYSMAACCRGARSLLNFFVRMRVPLSAAACLSTKASAVPYLRSYVFEKRSISSNKSCRIRISRRKVIKQLFLTQASQVS